MIEHRSHQQMLAMVKVAPHADVPVVQGLIGALENVVGSQVILLLALSHRDHRQISSERLIN